jgi:hypothetical protein
MAAGNLYLCLDLTAKTKGILSLKYTEGFLDIASLQVLRSNKYVHNCCCKGYCV